ncbi:MAG TPA: molybdate ABC transporter substrate-binding protein [Mobilitalea sp.]|nr:molybdate ABC transporter substrate-binding protein [Mobilitalea sp.]
MKRNLLRFMAILCIITLFTGCSAKTNSASETNSSNEVIATPTISAKAAPSETPVVTNAPVVTTQADSTIPATEIYVFIAASLNNAMTEIAAKYNETQPNVKITYNADSSGTLQTQIEEGAECDLFFSAAEKQMNTLKDEGYVEGDSVVNLLQNKVVLIKPKGVETAVTGFENIFDAKSLALAAESVPVGDYARQIFMNLGIWDKVQTMEINEGSNVTAVLTAVSEGSNEVGVVYQTDANSMKDSVEIIAEAPEGSLTSPVVYPVGLVTNPEADDTQTEAAKDFLKFLSSDESLSVFENYGFTISK